MDELLGILKKHEWLTTYEITKKIGVSWGTANTYCFMLKSEGKIELKEDEYRGRITRYWSLKG